MIVWLFSLFCCAVVVMRCHGVVPLFWFAELFCCCVGDVLICCAVPLLYC